MDGRTVQEEPVRDHGDRAGADPGDKFDPLFWGGYCVYRVKMCGQILLDIQRKVESVYEVKGKNNGRGCFD